MKLIRMATVCERCGDREKMIEWHSDDHPANPHMRIGNLVDDGKAIGIIVAEIDRCEALCHRCHMLGEGHIVRTGHRKKHGELNPRSRLTQEQVNAIRAAYEADSGFGRQAALARQFGVSLPTINHIVCGRTWRVV